MSAIVVRCAADLAAAGCPSSLAEQAWSKILQEQFDAGNYVVFGERSEDTDYDSESGNDGHSTEEEVEKSDQKGAASNNNEKGDELCTSAVEVIMDASSGRNESGVRGSDVSTPSMYSLHATIDMKPASKVFLIDHMW